MHPGLNAAPPPRNSVVTLPYLLRYQIILNEHGLRQSASQSPESCELVVCTNRPRAAHVLPTFPTTEQSISQSTPLTPEITVSAKCIKMQVLTFAQRRLRPRPGNRLYLGPQHMLT